MKFKATLIRLQDDGNQTLGRIYLHDGIEKVAEFNTLELSDKNNQKNISCIPRGTYNVRHRSESESGKFKYPHLLIKDVPNRSHILFHRGNFNYQIQGCILIGSYFIDINKDGLIDVARSKHSFDMMMSIVPKEFVLKII